MSILVLALILFAAISAIVHINHRHSADRIRLLAMYSRIRPVVNKTLYNRRVGLCYAIDHAIAQIDDKSTLKENQKFAEYLHKNHKCFGYYIYPPISRYVPDRMKVFDKYVKWRLRR